jgi:type IV pilus assembly protein PilA
MKNKKGFTLIELLAVIVILAIIALVAVPIVLNMIEGARKNAAKSSALGYIEAIESNNELYDYETSQGIENTSYTLTADGEDIETDNISIKIKGQEPDYGTVTIQNKKVIEADLCIGGYTVTYKNNKVELEKKCNVDSKIYTITFDSQGGSAVSNIQKQKNEEIGTLPTSTKEGYKFLGWFTDKESGEKITESTKIKKGTTYFAHWEEIVPVAFATDDWSTIAANTTFDKYNVGDTKCVALTGLTTTNNNGCSNGEFKVRIANKTACTTETSQTACGFVVEFVDIIALHNMNPSGEYKGTQYDRGWNVDGYPASAMYTYLNTIIYPKLKTEIGDIIIDTKTVSGHGNTTGETNFISTDKLYLLSTKEVGFDAGNDTAKTETRKLDYYDEGTGGNAKAKRLKQYNGSNKIWWLRSASSNHVNCFHGVATADNYDNYYAYYDTYGVSPVFRIGK